MCGTSGVFSIRMVNNTYPCQDNESASFNAGPGDSAYGVYTSAGFFFADCAFTSATSACPAHATFTCGPSSGIGDATGLESSATIEIDIDSNNTVSGTVTIAYTMGGTCTDTFTGSRDPDAMGL
jgi:hypothetical protein